RKLDRHDDGPAGRRLCRAGSAPHCEPETGCRAEAGGGRKAPGTEASCKAVGHNGSRGGQSSRRRESGEEGREEGSEEGQEGSEEGAQGRQEGRAQGAPGGKKDGAQGRPARRPPCRPQSRTQDCAARASRYPSGGAWGETGSAPRETRRAPAALTLDPTKLTARCCRAVSFQPLRAAPAAGRSCR